MAAAMMTTGDMPRLPHDKGQCMIDVEGLTKYYGSFLAVDGVSFGVPEGQVVGLLGPNGAGKTTIIRMLTCFMPATHGSARINGYDAFTQHLQVRQSVGYMPENVPLYEDMRVGEYLEFRCRIKAVEKSKRSARIDEVIQRCQLDDRRKQIIGTLSKGYRQRVGLADALIGNPPVLILDEPTVGLDPGQIREARNLIRELGRHRTVLLSSHILSEIEQICSSVIIIAGGQVVASGPIAELKETLAGGRQVILEGRGPEPEGLRHAIAAMPGVNSVQLAKCDGGYHRLTIEAARDADIRQAVGDMAFARGWSLRALSGASVTLEDYYIRAVTRSGASPAAAAGATTGGITSGPDGPATGDKDAGTSGSADSHKIGGGR